MFCNFYHATFKIKRIFFVIVQHFMSIHTLFSIHYSFFVIIMIIFPRLSSRVIHPINCLLSSIFSFGINLTSSGSNCWFMCSLIDTATNWSCFCSLCSWNALFLHLVVKIASIISALHSHLFSFFSNAYSEFSKALDE